MTKSGTGTVESEDSCDRVQAQNWSKARTIIVALIVLFPLFSEPVFGMARMSAGSAAAPDKLISSAAAFGVEADVKIAGNTKL